MQKRKNVILPIILSAFLILGGFGKIGIVYEVYANEGVNLQEIPPYTGNPYTIIQDNIPDFSDADRTTEAFERYSDLDMLGRCGTAYANICQELMPTEERSAIGQIKPSGWHTVKYDCIDKMYLYNRCHLIGYQLAGENANEKNLITGTRYLNVEGMLPFENMVADYVLETGNHVLYRVTPIYDGNNLLASGVQMEGESVEDHGEGIQFHVYCYNVQPGISIDYATGDSWLNENDGQEDTIENTVESGQTEDSIMEEENPESIGSFYIINRNTGKFHYPDCLSVGQMKESNKQEYIGSRDDLIAQGYSPCGNCKP